MPQLLRFYTFDFCRHHICSIDYGCVWRQALETNLLLHACRIGMAVLTSVNLFVDLHS